MAAAGDQFSDELSPHHPGQDTQCREDQQALQHSQFFNSVESGTSAPRHRHGRADQYQSTGQHPRRRQWAPRLQGRMDRVGDALQQRRLHLVRCPGYPLQDFVNLFVYHGSPPLGPFLSPGALICSRRFLYARCTFCFTDPTLEEVARATSSSDMPATFIIRMTSRWLSERGANSASRSSSSPSSRGNVTATSGASSRLRSRAVVRLALRKWSMRTRRAIA